ncbi:single-stranded DNA-binding protein [Jeotgalicoccus sp. S0W5]|uniref:single-stranded DNA-binding protein n=1 Tax=Jeotgalicoccus sp. S0W5 TaxID=2527874 RepID=UPI0014150AB3|nr:single-stranded DNA-binding protein [Jeotgalicoccus sp. S0W5]
MNQINLIGNLTADPELKYSQNQNAYVNFNVGVQRPFKDKQSGEYQSDFPRCKAFGKTAEIISEHFSKGSKIGITGSVQTGQYQDKDGKTVFTTDVMVNQVTFVERKQQSTNNYQQSNNVQANQTTGSKPSYEDNPFQNNQGPVNVQDDDLPF